jgi:hypothetical protein
VTDSASTSAAAANTTAASADASANNDNVDNGTGFIAIQDDPLIIDTPTIINNDGMSKAQV